jgi:hypothetical protein
MGIKLNDINPTLRKQIRVHRNCNSGLGAPKPESHQVSTLDGDAHRSPGSGTKPMLLKIRI